MHTSEKERDEATAKILAARLQKLLEIERKIRKYIEETETEFCSLQQNQVTYERGKQDAANGIPPREMVTAYLIGYSKMLQ